MLLLYIALGIGLGLLSHTTALDALAPTITSRRTQTLTTTIYVEEPSPTTSPYLSSSHRTTTTEPCFDCTRVQAVPGFIRVEADDPRHSNITATVIPHITQFANGSRFTNYETESFSKPDPRFTIIGKFTPLVTASKYVIWNQTLTVGQQYSVYNDTPGVIWHTLGPPFTELGQSTCNRLDTKSVQVSFTTIIPIALAGSIYSSRVSELLTAAADESGLVLPYTETCPIITNTAAPGVQLQAVVLTHTTWDPVITTLTAAQPEPVLISPGPVPSSLPDNPTPLPSNVPLPEGASVTDSQPVTETISFLTSVAPVSVTPITASYPVVDVQNEETDLNVGQPVAVTIAEGPIPVEGPMPDGSETQPLAISPEAASAPAGGENVIVSINNLPITVPLPISGAAITLTVDGIPISIHGGEVFVSGAKLPVATVLGDAPGNGNGGGNGDGGDSGVVNGSGSGGRLSTGTEVSGGLQTGEARLNEPSRLICWLMLSVWTNVAISWLL